MLRGFPEALSHVTGHCCDPVTTAAKKAGKRHFPVRSMIAQTMVVTPRKVEGLGFSHAPGCSFCRTSPWPETQGSQAFAQTTDPFAHGPRAPGPPPGLGSVADSRPVGEGFRLSLTPTSQQPALEKCQEPLTVTTGDRVRGRSRETCGGTCGESAPALEPPCHCERAWEARPQVETIVTVRCSGYSTHAPLFWAP